MRRISDSTVRRLSLYLRFLEEFNRDGEETVSSEALAQRGGTTSAQVRKDLSLFGSFGKRGLGYRVPELAEHLRHILGLSLENRALGRNNWNTYLVVAVDGVIKMSVNGKIVNGLSQSSQKKGYICMESEGAEIHFRNIKIMELPPGVTTPEQSAKPL